MVEPNPNGGRGISEQEKATQGQQTGIGEPVICAYARCGKTFPLRRKGQRFCCAKCCLAAWKEKREGTATVNEEPAPVLGIVLVMNGSSDGDKTNVPCGFCHRLNKVDLKKDGRQKAVCRCGARYFFRYRRRALGDGSGRVGYQGESGWKKCKQKVFFI